MFVKYGSSGDENVTAVVAPPSAANSAAAAACTGSLKLIRNAPRLGSASARSVEALEMIGTWPSTVSMQRHAVVGERRADDRVDALVEQLLGGALGARRVARAAP